MEAESPAVAPQETILVVDDEDSVRAFVSEALAREGYAVLNTADPLEARRIVTSRTVHLLLTDVVMPRMNGLELAEHVEAASPTTKVLLMSGYMTALMKASGRPILSKPFRIDALLHAVREALGSHSPFQRPEPR
jgi:DNA-binding NtrC family response regulator